MACLACDLMAHPERLPGGPIATLRGSATTEVIAAVERIRSHLEVSR